MADDEIDNMFSGDGGGGGGGVGGYGEDFVDDFGDEDFIDDLEVERAAAAVGTAGGPGGFNPGDHEVDVLLDPNDPRAL
ncbi:hypothetical protein CSUI_010247, partial [Cystoisospora suis]